MKIKKIVLLGLLTSLALIMFIIELQIPPMISIPGIKTGLANIIIVFILFLTQKGSQWKLIDIYIVQILRILIGTIFSSNPSAIFYSLVGGILSLTVMILVKKLNLLIPVISAVGGVFHNLGQLVAASVILGSVNVFYYLPILVISGILNGFLTGFIVNYIFKYHRNFINKIKKGSEYKNGERKDRQDKLSGP